MFGINIENIYDMNHMHDNKVNKRSECSLLHDMINTSRQTKNININYSPIINGFMNTRRQRKI